MKLWSMALVLCLIFSCTDINFDQDFELDTTQVELAVPLFNSDLSIPAINEASDINGNIEILPDGTIQVNYLGNVVQQNSTQIFAPIPGIFDLPIIDTIQSIQIPAGARDQITEAIIGNTNLEFGWGIDVNELVEIEVTLPELSLNGEIFKRSFSLDNRQGNQPNLKSGLISIEGYTLRPVDNKLTLKYRAIDSSSDAIILPIATIGFDIFTFQYVKGFFDRRTFDIQGDIITIDLFSKWISGGVDFLNPQVTLIVDNSFGLPTRSVVNFLDIITLDDRTLSLKSTLLDQGIEFEYPDLGETGEVKRTKVVFDKSNSNIRELFSSKAGKVSYDIDALINDGSSTQEGFLTDSSFFKIQVEVNLPIHGTVNDLVLQEITNLDLSSYDEVSSMEVDFIFSNGFPMDMMVQVYFDENGIPVDSLFSDQWLSIEGAPIDVDGLVIEQVMSSGTVQISEAKMDNMRSASAIRVMGRFGTGNYDQPVRLLEEYELGIIMGSKIQLQ